MYEYVPFGTLSNRLQVNKQRETTVKRIKKIISIEKN